MNRKTARILNLIVDAAKWLLIPVWLPAGLLAWLAGWLCIWLVPEGVWIWMTGRPWR